MKHSVRYYMISQNPPPTPCPKNPETGESLPRYNKISDNAVWQMLKDFAVVITGLQKSLERRCKYAPYKRGIHGEVRP